MECELSFPSAECSNRPPLSLCRRANFSQSHCRHMDYHWRPSGVGKDVVSTGTFVGQKERLGGHAKTRFCPLLSSLSSKQAIALDKKGGSIEAKRIISLFPCVDYLIRYKSIWRETTSSVSFRIHRIPAHSLMNINGSGEERMRISKGQRDGTCRHN